VTTWHVPQPDPLGDLVRCLRAIEVFPPSFQPRIVPARDLGSGRVYRERERFSGGVNLSAQERNAARLAEAEKGDATCYVEKATGNIYCSPNAAEKLQAQFPDWPIGPAPLKLDFTSPRFDFETGDWLR
jgi:hypothetical protein